VSLLFVARFFFSFQIADASIWRHHPGALNFCDICGNVFSLAALFCRDMMCEVVALINFSRLSVWQVQLRHRWPAGQIMQP
jgi:hypothetical protein